MNLTKLDKVLNNKIKLSKKEKNNLVNFIDFIPMYDIYTNKLHLISKNQLYDKMINYHYRFIDPRLFLWLKNKFNKLKKKKKLDFDEQINFKNLKNNINFLKNYDIASIYQKSIEIMYNFSPEVGLDITICKKKSFIPYFEHLTPYYSKDELINLGLNMGKIKKLNKEVLVDPEIHYKICKRISKNDVNSELILKNCSYIKNSDSKNLIQYYSLYGSFFINKLLRDIFNSKGKLNSTKINNELIINFAEKLNLAIRSAPKFDQDYIVYRFISDDSYLNKLKIGDLFTETGIMSTTRDPFYSNDDNDSFGFILMKIKLPKNIRGIGLNIECYSYFPFEQEIVLPPLTRYKLISKNDNFNYYHIDKIFQKKIKKKYEFEFYDILPFPKLDSILSKIKIPNINFLNIEMKGNNYIEKANYFINNFTNSINETIIKIGNKNYKLNTIWYDSTGPYEKFYYFKTDTGFSLTIYDENARVLLMIEINTEISVNYFMKWNSSNNGKEIIDDDNLIDFISKLAYSFRIPEIIIHFNYSTFNTFLSNYKSELEKDVLDCFSYPFDFYNYLKNNIKRFKTISGIKTGFNYFQLDKMKKIKLDYLEDTNESNIKKFLIENKNKSLAELYIQIIQNNFYLYDSYIEIINGYYNKESNPFNKPFYLINAYNYLYDNDIIKIVPDFEKTLTIKKSIINDEDYKNLFKSRFRLNR